MIGALGELSPSMLGFCLNMRLKGRVVVVYIVVVVYMQNITDEGFFTFKVGNLNSRSMLITPESGIRSTIKVRNKKGGLVRGTYWELDPPNPPFVIVGRWHAAVPVI